MREGRLDTLSKEAFQALMAALCRSYGTQLEAGADFLPVADRTSVSPTEIMSTTSGLLKAANLAVFELGMWQSWTGRLARLQQFEFEETHHGSDCRPGPPRYG